MGGAIQDPVGWLIGKGLPQRQERGDRLCDNRMLLDSGRGCPRCEDRQAGSRARRHAVAAADPAARLRKAAACGITARELTVLSLLADGLTALAIARRLSISPHTVNRHLEKIYRKLETHDRLATVMLARRLGLV